RLLGASRGIERTRLGNHRVAHVLLAHRLFLGRRAGEGASGETGRFPLPFSSARAAISAARGLRRDLKKGAREGNMVSPTGASRRRATLMGKSPEPSGPPRPR